MLKRSLSLKARAALILLIAYAAIFLGGFMLLSWQSLSSAGESHHAGPTIALTFAAGEIERAEGTLRLPPDGAFAPLAARNPRLWLLADDGGQRLAFGPVPPQAARLFDRQIGVLQTGRLHVPGIARPYSDTSVGRYGSLVIAAGGVDPATISLGDAFRYIVSEGLLVIVLGLGFIGLTSMLVALPLLMRALKPVTADAAAIRPDRPDRRIREDKVPGELLPLVRGFNSALDRLSGELVRRKRFIADVAHELRTPLSILSLQVESLDEDERKKDLQRVVTRMSHLVAQMLDVERLSLANQPRATADLAELARDIVADMAPMAMAAGYELSLDAPECPVPIAGDVHALGRAIGNLVGNAVAHAGGKGAIEVTVGEDRTLDVVDQGPGVAASMRGTLFEPFSRERWDRDGCGMGLHLTREIMRAHGGDAILLPSERGAAFRLEFPAPAGG